jgi:hypothetical protein
MDASAASAGISASAAVALAGGVACAVAAAATRALVSVGHRSGALDSAGAAGHAKELRRVPNIGGIAIVGTVSAALVAVLVLERAVGGAVGVAGEGGVTPGGVGVASREPQPGDVSARARTTAGQRTERVVDMRHRTSTGGKYSSHDATNHNESCPTESGFAVRSRSARSLCMRA